MESLWNLFSKSYTPKVLLQLIKMTQLLTGDVDDELSQIVKAREMAIQAKHQGLTFFVAMKTPTYRRVILIGCLLAAFQQVRFHRI